MEHDSNLKAVHELIDRVNLSERERLAARSQMRTAEAIAEVLWRVTAGLSRWARAFRGESESARHRAASEGHLLSQTTQPERAVLDIQAIEARARALRRKWLRSQANAFRDWRRHSLARVKQRENDERLATLFAGGL